MDDPARVMHKMWAVLPGVSEKTAVLFMKENINIFEFILNKTSYTVEVISEYKYVSGASLGSKRAKKIIAIQNISHARNQPYYHSILSCINGLTKATARKIIDEIGIEPLITRAKDEDIGFLRDMKKAKGTRRIGDALAQKIVDMITYSTS
jgi:hypothetical protein